METLTLILLAVLGMAIHLLMHVQKGLKKSNEKLNIKYLIRDNWLDFTISILATIALFIMLPDLQKHFAVLGGDGSNMDRIFSFMIGYFNRSIFRKLTGTFSKIAEPTPAPVEKAGNDEQPIVDENAR